MQKHIFLDVHLLHQPIFAILINLGERCSPIFRRLGLMHRVRRLTYRQGRHMKFDIDV